MDNPEYKKIKEQLKREIEETSENLFKSEKEILATKKTSEEALKETQKQKEYTKYMQDFVENMPDAEEYSPTPEQTGLIESGSRLVKMMTDHSRTQFKDTQEVRLNMDRISGNYLVGTTVSSSAASSFYSIGETMADTYPLMKGIIANYSLPSRFEKREKIENWLKGLNSLIYDKFKESFNSFIDREYMSATHAMREALSHLEDALAPEEELKKMPWYEPDTVTKKPTQRQRIKYAIIGSSSEEELAEKNLETIAKLMDEGRDIYSKLSKEAHRRKEKYDENIVDNYLFIAENIIEGIMKLREKYFIKSS